jgi:hypothetical protein
MNCKKPERITLRILKGLANILVTLVALPVVALLLMEGVALIFTDKIPMLFRRLSLLRITINPALEVLATFASNKQQDKTSPASIQ